MGDNGVLLTKLVETVEEEEVIVVVVVAIVAVTFAVDSLV